MFSGELPHFEGSEIIDELHREASLPREERPLLGVVTSDVDNPEHMGGSIEYIPLVLSALGSTLGDGGQVEEITATFDRQMAQEEPASVVAVYRPTALRENPAVRTIRSITIYATPRPEHRN